MHIRPASTLLLAGAGKTGAWGEGKLRRMEDEPLRSSAPPEFLKIAELKAWETYGQHLPSDDSEPASHTQHLTS